MGGGVGRGGERWRQEVVGEGERLRQGLTCEWIEVVFGLSRGNNEVVI